LERNTLLNQEVVSSLLQASVTGAGLVLAIYALIMPISRRLFERRTHTFIELTQRFEQSAKEAKPDLNDVNKLKDLVYKMSEVQDVPSYLRYGMGLTFFGYILSTLISVFWIGDWWQPTMDSLLPLAFFLTTLVFLLVGLTSINDINKIMKTDLEQIKKSLSESK
jgi:hypothetical protein